MMTEKETEAERQAKYVMQVEAVRSGMHHAALDMLKMMQEGNVHEGPRALLEGCLFFAVEMMENTMNLSGISPSESRNYILESTKAAVTATRLMRKANLKADTK